MVAVSRADLRGTVLCIRACWALLVVGFRKNLFDSGCHGCFDTTKRSDEAYTREFSPQVELVSVLRITSSIERVVLKSITPRLEVPVSCIMTFLDIALTLTPELEHEFDISKQFYNLEI